jgi:gluconokinase
MAHSSSRMPGPACKKLTPQSRLAYEKQIIAMIVIVMGVVGAGKTTVGRLLAEQLGGEFADADDFHPAANVEKIRNGIALNDDDRAPWLNSLHAAIAGWIADKHDVVLACSALKSSYRRELEVGPDVRFVYLKGSASEIAERLRSRHGHFADEKILASQFADLEEPEGAVTVEISSPPQQIVAEIRERLGLA